MQLPERNRSKLKIIRCFFSFLVGFVVGLTALWIVLQFDTGLRYFFQEPTLGHTPQPKISGFMAAVNRGDKSAVFDYWEIGASPSDAMRARRETIVNELLQLEDEMMYRIMRVEWWRTCCEPGIVHEFMDAGGSRYSVQIYNTNGWSTTYTFDVFVEGLVYFGAAEGYLPRHWLIRDVYPAGVEPLYWPYRFEGRVEHIGAK
jgi:hypothetical protein